MEQQIQAAAAWLCESDVINKDNTKASHGGINNGYLWREKTYQYVYNEITGYAINAFLLMHNWFGDEKYLQLSKDAADYLIRLQEKDSDTAGYGAILHSLILPGLKPINKYYTFDNAVILHGLIHLYGVSRDPKYREASLSIGNWLLRMQKEDGSFFSHYDAETDTIKNEYDEFFYDNGCLHVKHAIGLMYLRQLSDDDRFFNAGIKVCDWGRSLMDADGLFWANIRKKYVFTHAHCYATEGYLYAYHLSKKKEYLDIAVKAGDALIGLQNPDGSLYRIYKNKITMKRWFGNRYKYSIREWRNEKKHPWKTIDATTQAVRIWSLLYSVTHDEKYFGAATRADQFIAKMQVMDAADQNMNGGLYYQLCDNSNKKETTISGGMYTWCTQFALSAFMMLASSRKKVQYDELIQMLY